MVRVTAVRFESRVPLEKEIVFFYESRDRNTANRGYELGASTTTDDERSERATHLDRRPFLRLIFPRIHDLPGCRFSEFYRQPLPFSRIRGNNIPETMKSIGTSPNRMQHALNLNELPLTTMNNRQTIYDDGDDFLNSCAELASYTDSPAAAACDRGDSTATWLSQLRQTCFRIRNWLPKMCSCLESGTAFLSQSVGNYQRLTGKGNNVFEFARSTNKLHARVRFADSEQSDDSEREEEKIEELQLYCEDETLCKMIVEKNLRTIDLCELVKVKKCAVGFNWSIVEIWPELGMERTLEDHEDVLAVYREETTISPTNRSRKFLFREDFLKYEFFYDPREFFPAEMIDVPAIFAENNHPLVETKAALRSYLQDEDVECPTIFSLVWIQIGRLNVWRRIHLLLRDRKLYQAKKNTKQVYPFAQLSDYAVYRITNARRRFKAPFPWGICLRPTTSNNAARRTEDESGQSGEAGLKVIAFHSEKSRACWLTAMRLAKYGKQLRENYRAFKNKQCEQSENSKDRYVNYNVSNESVRSLVAMDFTGSVGRIVEDPKEAKNIAESEGVNWRRSWRPFSRPPPGCAVVRLHGLDDGIHVLQPWFHRGLKREIAATIVRDYGSADGVFLVRESKSNLGAYVLTYKYSEKVFHAQIQPVFDERCNCWLYTLDKGRTRFYDLLQLIEFYQLNAGCLPTRLTHYVQNGVPTMLPLPVPLSQVDDDDEEEDGAEDSPSSLTGEHGTAATSNTVEHDNTRG